MVITFGNQKGGVGKTTLCTLFASYLAEKGKKTLVVDCDNQQTISEKRTMDKKKYPDTKVPYLVQAFDIGNMDNVSKMMQAIQSMDGMVLIDSPGNLTQQGLIPIFLKSDYVVNTLSAMTPLIREKGISLLLTEILRLHLFRKPYPIVGEVELAAIGQHLLTVDLDDEWRAMPGTDVDGSLFIWGKMDVEPGAW